MVTKPAPGASPSNQKEAQTQLQQALARLKSATDRQAVVVGVLSRLGLSAQDKRLAQAENKKVDRELRDARQSLKEAQAQR